MFARGIATGAVLLALGQGTKAEERPSILHRASCTIVRYYVAKYSASAAEMWARGHGATDAEIENARHCLAGVSVHTAAVK
jgi:hypothetical protein